MTHGTHSGTKRSMCEHKMARGRKHNLQGQTDRLKSMSIGAHLKKDKIIIR